MADDTDRTPEDYGSALVLLAEAGVIGDDLGRRWQHLEHLGDLESFVLTISEHMARS